MKQIGAILILPAIFFSPRRSCSAVFHKRRY